MSTVTELTPGEQVLLMKPIGSITIAFYARPEDTPTDLELPEYVSAVSINPPSGEELPDLPYSVILRALGLLHEKFLLECMTEAPKPEEDAS